MTDKRELQPCPLCGRNAYSLPPIPKNLHLFDWDRIKMPDTAFLDSLGDYQQGYTIVDSSLNSGRDLLEATQESYLRKKAEDSSDA